MISDARGSHVSPGIYTEEKDVTYSVKSLGITSLGLVGETLYGPAFENVEIENWSEFVDYFGGTSTEKFKDGGLPKYELPYIAKSYLEESKRLNVVRVLGLSGYHAGPFWAVQDENEIPIVVIRSKMIYGLNVTNPCLKQNDVATPVVNNVTIEPYQDKIYNSACEGTGEDGEVLSGDTYFRLVVSCTETQGFMTRKRWTDTSRRDFVTGVLISRNGTLSTISLPSSISPASP